MCGIPTRMPLMQRRFTGYSTYKRRQQRGALAVQLMVLTLALIGGAGYFANSDDAAIPQTNVASDAPSVTTPVSAKSNLDQTLELRDANGGTMQARFTRKIADGKSAFAVIGELPKPAKGMYYEVWAVQPDPYKFMSLGGMVERTDAKYGLVFESKDDLRGFSEIIITLEKDDKDPTPSTHILEGKF